MEQHLLYPGSTRRTSPDWLPLRKIHRTGTGAPVLLARASWPAKPQGSPLWRRFPRADRDLPSANNAAMAASPPGIYYANRTGPTRCSTTIRERRTLTLTDRSTSKKTSSGSV